MLGYLVGETGGVEPGLDHHPAVAFNLTTLAMLCGTPLMPGLSGHVVMVEEVCEHLYAVDRLFFHVTAHLGGIAGLRRWGGSAMFRKTTSPLAMTLKPSPATGARAMRSPIWAGRISATMLPTGSCRSDLRDAGRANNRRR